MQPTIQPKVRRAYRVYCARCGNEFDSLSFSGHVCHAPKAKPEPKGEYSRRIADGYAAMSGALLEG